MGEFAYRGHKLHVEHVPLTEIARAVGTPVYVYSAAGMRARARRFLAAFAGQQLSLIHI